MAMRPPSLVREIWSVPRPLVGMVHLLPLPGSPRWGGSLAEVRERALADARLLAEGGLDGVLAENYLDAPFYPDDVPAETTAAMAVLVAEIVRSVAVPVGVNVLRNDAAAALAICAASGARFVRVNVHTGAMLADQGWLTGRAHETLRTRARLGLLRVAILADVLVKHAAAPAGLEAADAARDAWHRGLADALIVTGAATGETVAVERLRTVRAAVPEAPVWIGSGLTAENAPTLLPLADGAIVGSALQRDGVAGAGVEAARVRGLVQAWKNA